MEEKAKQIQLLTRRLYVFIGVLVIFTLVNWMILSAYNNTKAPLPIESTESTIATSWSLKSLAEIPKDQAGAKIRYGYELIINTAELIGPRAKDASLRYAGNNLACNNCHLDAGRKIGSGSFVGVSNRFPQFRGRENKIGNLEERINGCLERSMNGRTMSEDAKEMQAMIAYMDWLSQDVPEDIEKKYKGYVSIKLPNEAADPSIGKQLYTKKCTVCHQTNGEGIPKGEGLAGYLYPPLGGHDTYNDGAGMHRVITAAEFLKANMPFGATYDAPQLSDTEAYHLAAYINTFTRPEKSNKTADFPDKKLKPVSTPYGPWVDSFSQKQHQFGPFQPIMDFYQKEYQLVKKK
ncbi:hypothetical protein GCM10011416_15530 [Polaribacter pacificus]|uniref:Cytochrome c domain-containing protein n=1 Tax=Polaribacter pacificus TaxID=1775173 RepID=A0A917HYX9_9FLAO|nr:c-type cytochrome [Polaribacter pacificus]GGG98325.1 hypothetical protein GCM10011416_15530 [Polaribacter pacificus]